MRASLIVLLLLSAACSMVQPSSATLGSEQNPVKLALAPATDTPKALATGERLTKLLEQETGLRYKLSVPTSHAAVIEAMGTNNVDVGWLSPLGYLLARERVGAEPLLAGLRGGSATAPSLPIAVATIERAPPNVREQLRAIVRTGPFPNDTISVRKGVPPETVKKLRDGFRQVAASPAGQKALYDLYGIEGLGSVTDADFDSLRSAVRALSLDLGAELALRQAP